MARFSVDVKSDNGLFVVIDDTITTNAVVMVEGTKREVEDFLDSKEQEANRLAVSEEISC